jgi:hypothetical protein
MKFNTICLIITALVNAQESCGIIDNPINSKDCTMMSTKKRSCCYKYKDGESAKCIDYSVPKYNKFSSDDGYNIICPLISEPVAEVSLYCGENNPKPKDCSRYSTDSSSCCYMVHKGQSYCINLGLPYTGNQTVGEDIISCSSHYIYISYILLLIFFS